MVILWKAKFKKFHNFQKLLEKFLSKEEIVRAFRYKFNYLRSNYIIARGILKILLAFYTNCDISNINIKNGKNGKPYIDHISNIKFNISHSSEWFVIGIGYNYELGVDIEKETYKNYLSLAHFFFTKEEYFHLLDLPFKKQRKLFFQIWVQKEAFVKAEGVGLQFGLNQFLVSCNNKPGLLKIYKKKFPYSQWKLYFFSPEKFYFGAIAVNKKISKLSYYSIIENIINKLIPIVLPKN